MHPFLWRFWIKTPEKGRIAIFDRSWYRRVLSDRFDKLVKEEEIPNAFSDIQFFEKQLTDDGMVIIKLFLYISKKDKPSNTIITGILACLHSLCKAESFLLCS